MSTLNENILKVKETFEDIASAIADVKGEPMGECVTPTDYADEIRKLAAKSGLTAEQIHVQAYSTEDSYPTVSSEPTEDGGIMITFGLQRGMKGEPGERGRDGAQGEQGPQGRDGKDGTRFEFIYKRVADENVYVEAPNNEQEDGYVPTLEGWTANAEGITDDLRVEYMCQREKVDGVWSNWSDPSVWSVYGKNGRDGNGVEYIFCLTSSEDDIPTLPTSDPYNDESNIEFPLIAGKYQWTDNHSSVTESLPVCWVASRKQAYYDDKQLWGEYKSLSIWAKYGKDGLNGLGGRTLFVYTISESFEPKPSIVAPQGGTWNPETNELTGVASLDGYAWSIVPPEKTEFAKFIWQSVGNFDTDGNLIGEWSAPFCITGEKGRDGMDGTSIEFIYRRISNQQNLDELKEWLLENPLQNTETNVVPDAKDEIIATEWTDEPAGIDGETYLIEIVCSRKANLIDGQFSSWGPWSAPSIWAKWGEDGNDGPGVEYIFRVTPDSEEWTADKLFTEFATYDIFENERYQEDGFYPGEKYGIDLDWTDEPQDVSPNQPVEWVSIRKGVVDQVTGKVEWGMFSVPKVWAKYATNGYSYKTSYVFTRSNSKPTDPVRGGDFNHAYPTIDGSATGAPNPIWSDSILEGEGLVWMSYRTFRSDNNLEVDNDWSTPVQMSDIADKFQVEFTSKDLATIDGYTITKYTGNEDAFRYAEAEKGVDWNEGENVTDAIYMATVSCHQGIWGDWTVTRIKGEKGDTGEKGADGSSVYIEGKFEKLDDLKSAWTKYTEGDGSLFTGTLDPGDGYFVEEDGYLYIYSGGWISGEDNVSFEAYWTGVELKGEKGEDGIPGVNGEDGRSAYVYVKYSDDGVTFTERNGETPGKYIAVLFGYGEIANPNDITLYTGKWHLWNGEDGWGKEQIFLLTTDEYDIQNPPLVPTDCTAIPEYLPAHGLGNKAPGEKWCDSPQTPSDTYPYCWVVSRSTKAYDGWKGTTIDGTEYASLYTKLVHDGADGIAHYLELSNDQAIIPLQDDGQVDVDFNDPVTTTMTLYHGARPVESTPENPITYSVSDENAASVDENGVVTVDVSKLNDVTYIDCKAHYLDADYKRRFYIHKTTTAYELSVDKHVLRRDPVDGGYLMDGYKKVNVTVKKWNGTNWSVPDNKIIYAKIMRILGEDSVIEMSKVNWNDNVAEFDFSDEANVTNIRFYILDDNNNELVFEEIGVVVDGEDGPGEEYIYYACDVNYTDGSLPNPTPETKGDNYQLPNWHDAEYNGISWTDEPSGVSINSKFEYVSRRKKQNGVWGDFSDPKLWAKFGVDGKDADTVLQDAPIIYPAGVWNAEKTYVATEQQRPYVYYNEQYYVLHIGHTSVNENPATSEAWEQMESFKSIHADVGVLEQALVGPLVFYKDYVFSQEGVAKASLPKGEFSKGESITYSDIIEAWPNYSKVISLIEAFDRWFVPNFKLNAKTGEVVLNKLVMKAIDSEGTSTSTEMSLDAVVEDIMGQKVVKTYKGNIGIVEDFLNRDFISAANVKDLINISDRLINQVDKILIEIGTSGSISGSGVGGWDDVDDNLDKIYFGEGAAIVANLRSTTGTEQYFVQPLQTYSMVVGPTDTLNRENECYPTLSKFKETIEYYYGYGGGGNCYPINIGGKDDDVLLDPITEIEIPITDSDGNKPTIGWLKDQIKQIRKFGTWVEQLEEVVIGKRTSQILGGISYLKDVYKDASTEIEGGAITTGVVLGGTIAVKGDDGNGDRIVAGLHNGSEELLGSQGSGLMLFTGAEGIETVTEEIDGVVTKTSTSVNNASIEFYKDGSGKIGSSTTGSKITWDSEAVKFGEISITDDGELKSVDSSNSNAELTFGNGKITLRNPNGSNTEITPRSVEIEHNGASVHFGDCGNVSMRVFTKDATGMGYCPDDSMPQVGIMINAAEEGVSISNSSGQFENLCPKTTVVTTNDDSTRGSNVIIVKGDVTVVKLPSALIGMWVRVINTTAHTVSITTPIFSDDIIVNLSSYTGDNEIKLPKNSKVDFHCVISEYADEDYNYHDWYAVN